MISNAPNPFHNLYAKSSNVLVRVDLLLYKYLTRVTFELEELGGVIGMTMGAQG